MHSRVSGRFGSAALLAGLAWSAACSSDGRDPIVNAVQLSTLAPGDQLLEADVDAILAAASQSVDSPNLSIAVVDRLGNILRVYDRTGGAAGDPQNRYSVALARAAAYLSHTQAPLTSRTGQFLSTFHFPGVFDQTSFLTAPPDAFPGFTLPIQPTLGITNTPQAPLWQIDASNRGGMVAGVDLTYAPFVAPIAPPPTLTNPDGTTPTPGLGPLPGAVPLYKQVAAPAAGDVFTKRLVGAIGAYSYDTDPDVDPRVDVGEFVAVNGVLAPNPAMDADPATPDADFFFQIPLTDDGPLTTEGGVFLAGILLPAIDPVVQPAGTGPGPPHNPALEICSAGACGPADGAIDAEGDLVTPTDSMNPMPAAGGLTAAEVTALLDGCEVASQNTHAAIRLPPFSQCKMIISVCDLDGNIIGVRREQDATMFSLEISVSKARNAVYFSNPFSIDTDPAAPLTTGGTPTTGRHPLFRVFGDETFGDPSALDLIEPAGAPADPRGIAVTARSLGFLSQPFYPPTIDASAIVGPFNDLVAFNRDPANFDRQGFGSVDPAAQSGIIFFPGSAPLYRDGQLIGGIGVSGDGVEQDDVVTFLGIRNAEAVLGFDLEPPADIRIDNFTYAGVRIPYMKFPQNPGG